MSINNERGKEREQKAILLDISGNYFVINL
jgi:hypothetical protein